MNFIDLVHAFPEVNITVKASELEAFGIALVKKAKDEAEAEALRRMIQEKESRALLTAKEAAEFFGVSTKTITRWRASGYLPSVPVGGLYKYRRSDCRRLLNEQNEGRA